MLYQLADSKKHSVSTHSGFKLRNDHPNSRSFRRSRISTTIILSLGCALLTSTVQAVCTGPETVGNDTVICNGTNPGVTVATINGDDDIHVNSDSLGYVEAGAGEDLVVIRSGTVIRVEGGTGNDDLQLRGGAVTDTLNGQAGDDQIKLFSGSANYVNGASGTDTILIQSVPQVDNIVTTDVFGGTGDDTIRMNSGSIGGDILGGGGIDQIVIAGGSIGGRIFGGTGNDRIVIDEGLSGGVGDISITGTGGVNGGAGDDSIRILGGATVSYDVAGQNGEDTIFIDGAATLISGSILGGADNDLIRLNSGSVTNRVDGGTGDDTITIAGDTATPLVTGNNGSDTVYVTITATNLPTVIDGGDGVDGVSGWNDVLQFHPWSGSVIGSNLQNFETINLSDASLTFSGTDTLTTGADGVGQPFGFFMSSGSTIDLSGIPRITGDQLTITGDYTSYGGTLSLDVALDATEAHDRLVLAGGDISGNTIIDVNDVGTGIGAPTGTDDGDGLLLVDGSGSNSASEGAFSLSSGPMIVGAVRYDLDFWDNSWYLQGDLLEQVYAYQAYAQSLTSMETIGTLHQRVGHRNLLWEFDGAPEFGSLGAWFRVNALTSDLDPETGFAFDQSTVELEAGVDWPLHQSASGLLVGGIQGRFVDNSVDADNDKGMSVSSIATTGWGIGGSLTWYGESGFYTDGVLRATWYDSDFSVNDRGQVSSTNGSGYGASLETGWRVAMSETTSIVPQLQLMYGNVDFDDFTDADGVDVKLLDGESLIGRAGLVYELRNQRKAGEMDGKGDSKYASYVGADIYQRFDGDTRIDASGLKFTNDLGDTWGALKIGGTASVSKNSSFYGEVNYNAAFGNSSNAFQATAGVRSNW